MTTRLILDVDTGTDDAVAIMAAALHPALDLLAVTTVNGNVPLANTTENTLRVLDHIGRGDVPVHSGAARPFARPDFPIPRRILNGGRWEDEDAQIHPDYLDLAPSTTPLASASAVRFLIDTYLDDANADVVLVAVGPLTNLALALVSEPSLASRIPKLVIMGGAHAGGNVTAAAEFNFWVDPEAARSVLNAGIREVVIVPLDATHSAALGEDVCDALEALGTPAGDASNAFIRHRIKAEDTPERTSAVHDPLTIASLVVPEVLTETVRAYVSVETAGEQTIGELLVDTRPWSTETPNATVALRASSEVFRDFLLEAFAAR